MNTATITRYVTIEELMQILPAAVGYLRDRGIRCVMCGEPVWGTLESAAREKGFGDDDIDRFVSELNALRSNTR